nr:Hpt domain-containing protein [uncultured Steroidobacter sp.]
MVAPLRGSRSQGRFAAGSAAGELEPRVLDTTLFGELLGSFAGDLDIVISIYRTFVGTTIQLIDALPDQDCATQTRTLHTLKGSAAMVGAERIAQLAARLHRVAASSVHPIVKTRIDELTGELDSFREALRAHADSVRQRSGT